MRNKKFIRYSAFLLTLVYLFANCPAIMFHHHNSTKAFFDTATACEKSVYFADTTAHCGHTNHISTAAEKCPLCDHHNLTTHTIYTPVFSPGNVALMANTISSEASFISALVAKASNRGPPLS